MSKPEEFQQSWSWPEWLEFYPLNKLTVFDYFKSSEIYYDRTCNNEKVNQERLDPSMIKNMEGVYYEIDEKACKDNSFFIIRKLLRTRKAGGSSSSSTGFTDKLLALYYVVGNVPGPMRGTIFSLPDMHSVLSYQLSSAQYYAANAFKELHKHVLFNRGKEHTWDHGDFFGSEMGKNTKKKRKKEKVHIEGKRNEKDATSDSMLKSSEAVGQDQDEDNEGDDDRHDEHNVKLVSEVLQATLFDKNDIETLRSRSNV